MRQGAFGIALSLVARRGQLGDAILERRVVHVDHAILDRVIEALELRFGLGRAPFKIGDMLAALVHPLVAPFEDLIHQSFEPRRVEQPGFEMIDHGLIEPIHRHGDAGTAGRSLPRLRRTGVVAVFPPDAAGAGAQRHRAAAARAEADAGEQRRAAHRHRRHHLRAARLERPLDSLELRFRDNRRHFHDGMFALRLRRLRLVIAGIEAVLADIGRPGEHLMHRTQAPAPAVAGADVVFIEPCGDRLETHRPFVIDAVQCHAIDAPHRLGLDWVDLQLLLDLRSALSGRDHAIADRRTRAVPEALPRVLLHRPQRVLAVLLRLILVEQRHDLAHHHAHGIVAQVLRDRDELHPVLCQLANVELELELVAEEPREAVDEDDVERRRLLHRRVDHRLESGATIVGRRVARLDELGRDLPAARQAIALDLAALVRDRQIAIGLAAGRNAQVERRAGGRHNRCPILISSQGGAGHDASLLTSRQRSEQLVQRLPHVAFNRAQLGVADRNLLRPVIGDDDRPIIFAQPTRSAAGCKLTCVVV